MSVDVLHLSTERSFRGGERQLLLLHEGLADRGITSHILCRKGGALEARAAARVTGFAWSGLADLAGLARARRLSAALAPALLHCHDSKAFTLGSVIGRLQSVPVVTTRRVMFPIRSSVFNRWKYRRATRVVAVSSGVAARVAEIAARGKISVVPDGVSWEGPALTRRESRRELGLEPEGLVVGTAGFFTHEKNLRLIFELASVLRRTDPAVRLACIGPMDSAAARKASSLPGLLAPGPVREASRYYTAFDLYISPSTAEGLGTALLDAVVRDIPAIAFDAGGTRDIYPSDSPWLIPDGDAAAFTAAVRAVMRDLSEARKTARRYGERARGIFSIPRMVNGNAAVYRDLLGRSSLPRGETARAARRAGPGRVRR